MRFFLLSATLLCIPTLAGAQVSITEVMYNLGSAEGNETDSGREWIEVHNGSGEPINLENWRFTENKTNHLLEVHQGDGTVPAGSYVVIADDPESFLADWPDFSGALFNSAFSLKNTGETLALTDPDGNVSYDISYNPSIGADGDGNSLQWDGSAFIAGTPTPGATNVSESGADSREGSDGNTTYGESAEGKSPGNTVPANTNKSRPREPAFDAVIEGPEKTVAGAYVELRGMIYDEYGAYENPARYLWSFGDGSRGEGEYVSHMYSYPGKYIVFLTAGEVGGELAAGARHVISVSEADVSITEATNERIAVRNNASGELDLSRWHIQAAGARFTIPERTVILPETAVYFDSNVTNLAIRNGARVTLLYPNGEVAAQYSEEPRTTVSASASAAQTPRAQPPRNVQSVQIEAAEAQPNTETGTRKAKAAQSPATTSLAAAGDSNPQQSLTPFLLALAGILGLSVIVVLLTRPGGEDEAEITPLTAEDFTIIEEDSDTYAAKSE